MCSRNCVRTALCAVGLLAAATVPTAADSAAGTDNAASRSLHRLFADEWSFRLQENPLLATAVGHHETNHLLPSLTEADAERRAAQRRAFLAELDGIDREALGIEDRISYDVFKRELVESLAEHELGADEMAITVDSGFHIAFARLPAGMPFATVADYENYIARLRAFPVYAEQNVARLRRGLERGMTLPRVVLDGYEVTIESHVVDAVEKSVFWQPFVDLPPTLNKAEGARLRQAGRAAIREAIVPAYRSVLEFMVDEYMPGARSSLGASELPDGRRFYAQRIRRFTTLDLTAKEIHRIGLDEVRRIRVEMQETIAESGFTGSFAAFLEFLRTDPQFYAKTADELLEKASYLSKKMDGKLPALFGRLPRQPYGVAPVPDHLAPKYTGGRYVGAALDSTQPGWYWVNTYALENRPLYVLPALTLHEAVPGHHLQISLNKELEDLPDFRRNSYISAFGEGWGLYSEWLGLEAGMYPDPYTNFGRLTYEMWRACRLVVDTGLHAKGWTRERAMEYLTSNTALSLHEVRTETDRYISWPGQALAYKIGELEIRKLRREAEERLGAAFDLRGFHDVVLGHGSVPLDVLGANVRRWIDEAAAGS